MSRQRGNQRRDGRPLDSLEHSQQKKRRDHRRARIAGADDADRVAFLDQFRADPDGGIPFAAGDLRRLLVHFNPLGGVVDAQAGKILHPLAAHLLPDKRLIADQDDLDPVLADSERGPLDLGGRSVIAPHSVQRDSHVERSLLVRLL